MSWSQGAAVQWDGKTWHVFNHDRQRETVELCSHLLMHGLKFGGKAACTHVVVTEQALAQGAKSQAVRGIFEQIVEAAHEIAYNYSLPNHLPAAGGESVDGNDRHYAQRQSCYGWSVLWQEPTHTEPGDLFEYAGELHADGCGSLEACWDFCDYLVDDEVGVPLAIRDSLKCAYYRTTDGGRWFRNRDEYPSIPAGYNADGYQSPTVVTRDEAAYWMESFPDDVLDDPYFKDELERKIGERMSNRLRQQIINNVRRRAHNRDMGHS